MNPQEQFHAPHNPAHAPQPGYAHQPEPVQQHPQQQQPVQHLQQPHAYAPQPAPPHIPQPQHHMPQYAPAAPTPVAPALSRDASLQPTPVLRVLSPLGVEYAFLMISLLVSASAIVAVLLIFVSGSVNFDALSFPAAMLVTALPIFAFIFLRLKNLELQDASLKYDMSRRRFVQRIQILTFLVSLLTTIGLIFSIFAKLSGQTSVPIGKSILDALSILVVAGGILVYYWRTERALGQ